MILAKTFRVAAILDVFAIFSPSNDGIPAHDAKLQAMRFLDFEHDGKLCTFFLRGGSTKVD